MAVISFFVFFLDKSKRRKKLTPLAAMAFCFVLAGICFGENRLIGYGLMGIGIILAVLDIIQSKRVKNTDENIDQGISKCQ